MKRIPSIHTRTTSFGATAVGDGNALLMPLPLSPDYAKKRRSIPPWLQMMFGRDAMRLGALVLISAFFLSAVAATFTFDNKKVLGFGLLVSPHPGGSARPRSSSRPPPPPAPPPKHPPRRPGTSRFLIPVLIPQLSHPAGSFIF